MSKGDLPISAALDGIEPPCGGRLDLAVAAAQFKPRIEGYEIEDRIGEGGMATVWCAKQLSTQRKVALKLLTAGPASEQARIRFDREVHLAARLEHPNIARIYDSGVDRGVYFFAMELVHGEPLDEYVEARNLSRRQILELMHTVAWAVQHAHQHGVIHRDLKPINILVTPDGQPHLLDFGLARPMSDETGSAIISQSGEISGTPAYMSPEQAAGRMDRLDLRTDVYSLGVVLYKLLTRQWPHEMSGPPHEILRKIREEDVIPPHSFTPDLDREIESILLKALARNPDDRYLSAGQLATDIRHYLAGDPISARPASLGYLLQNRLRKHGGPIAAVATVFALIVIAALVEFPRFVAGAGITLVLAVIIIAYVQVRRQRDQAVMQRRRSESLLRISQALNQQGDLPALWNLILTEARFLSGADAGSLFICREESLEIVAAQNQTLSERLGSGAVADIFRSMHLPMSERSIASYVAHTGKPVNLPDAHHVSSRLPFKHNTHFDEKHAYDARSILAVPLLDGKGKVLGVLELINCLDPSRRPIPFSEDRQRLTVTFASMAAVALRLHHVGTQ